MTEIRVQFRAPRGIGVEGTYALRERVLQEAAEMKIGATPIHLARYVAGGVDVSFLGDAAPTADFTLEAQNEQEALVAAGLAAGALLRQGFTVKPGGEDGSLIVRDVTDLVVPEEMGEARVAIYSPLGQR